MIIGSIVVAMQMGYIQKKDLGFDREQILMLALNDTAIVNNVTAFMEKIERHPSVEGTALSTTAPGRFYGKQVMTAETNDGEMGEKAFNNCFVSYDYMEVMGLTLGDLLYRPYYHYCCTGIVGTLLFYDGKANPRNRGQKSDGCFPEPDSLPLPVAILQVGNYLQFGGMAPLLFCHEKLVAELHLQDRLPVLDLYHIFVAIVNHCRDHR